MKKLALLFSLSILIGCKQHQQPGNPAAANKTKSESLCADNSDIMPPNNKIKMPAEQLQKQGQIICDLRLYSDIEKYHSITDSAFAEILKNFWGSDPVVYKSVSWQDLKKLTKDHCYDTYVAFRYDGAAKDAEFTYELGAFDAEILTDTCFYSVPLFRSIALNHNLCNTDVFFCTKAKMGNKVIIVFKVKDKEDNYYYYDITENPE